MAQYTAVTVSPNLLKFNDHDIDYGLFALAVKQGMIADQSIFGYWKVAVRLCLPYFVASILLLCTDQSLTI